MNYHNTFKGRNGFITIEIDDINKDDLTLIEHQLQDVVDGFRISRPIPGDGIPQEGTRGYIEWEKDKKYISHRIIFNNDINNSAIKIEILRYLKNKTNLSLVVIKSMFEGKEPTQWMSEFDFQEAIKYLDSKGIDTSFYEVEHSEF